MKPGNVLRSLTILVAVAAMLSACSGTSVRFGPMSGVKYDASRGRQISAEACGFQLLLLIPTNNNTRANRAYLQLLKEAGPDYVTDIKVRERWTYAFVGTLYCTSMQAMAYPRLPL